MLGTIVEQVVQNTRTLGAKSGSALGSWVIGQYYIIGDIVNYQGQLYTALANGAGSAPSSSPGSWGLTMASLPMTTATDPAINAAVSTALIDSFSGVIITLGAAGNDQTLQDPTVTTAGRVYWVVNDDLSTDPIDIIGASYTITLQPGESSKWIYDGSGWIHASGADANDIDFNPSSGFLTATNVQAAFDELLNAAGLVIPQGLSLFLDGGGDTHIISPNANEISLIAGGATYMNASHTTQLATFGNQAGAYVDTANGLYQFGDWDSNNNGTNIVVDDDNENIKTWYAGEARGLNFDFANSIFYLGDFNAVENGTHIIVNDSTERIEMKVGGETSAWFQPSKFVTGFDGDEAGIQWESGVVKIGDWDAIIDNQYYLELDVTELGSRALRYYHEGNLVWGVGRDNTPKDYNMYLASTDDGWYITHYDFLGSAQTQKWNHVVRESGDSQGVTSVGLYYGDDWEAPTSNRMITFNNETSLGYGASTHFYNQEGDVIGVIGEIPGDYTPLIKLGDVDTNFSGTYFLLDDDDQSINLNSSAVRGGDVYSGLSFELDVAANMFAFYDGGFGSDTIGLKLDFGGLEFSLGDPEALYNGNLLRVEDNTNATWIGNTDGRFLEVLTQGETIKLGDIDDWYGNGALFTVDVAQGTHSFKFGTVEMYLSDTNGLTLFGQGGGLLMEATPNYGMVIGDIDYVVNGTQFILDDFNRTIQTTEQGFRIDNANQFTEVGDWDGAFNEKNLIIDNNNELVQTREGTSPIGLDIDWGNEIYHLGDWDELRNGSFLKIDDGNGQAGIFGCTFTVERLLIHESGVSTLNASGHVTTEKSWLKVIPVGGPGAGADDLVTCGGGTNGARLILSPNASGASNQITVKDGTGAGAFICAGGADFVMDHVDDRIEFLHNGTEWVELSRSSNS